jgi:trigger factor
MKTSVEEISPVKKKLLVEVESAEVDRKIEETYRTLGKKAKVHGFRPGKVPRRILERYFKDQVVEEVTRGLVDETLPKAVEESKAMPLAIPMVENDGLKAGESFKYAVVMEVKPQFELRDYMGVELEKEIVEVTDQDVERNMQEIRKAHAILKPVQEDRGAREGDSIVVDYEAFEAGKPIEGVKAQNFMIALGGGAIHPDLEKGLTGLKAGDWKEVEVHFDEKHQNATLAGKDVTFKVKVTDLKITELPELNDEFAKSLGGEFPDLETLKKRVKDSLRESEEKRVEKDFRRRLIKKIADKVDFELPQSLVDSEIRSGVESVKQNLLRMGSNMEKAGIKEEKLREDLVPAAGQRVKELLIMGEIARQSGLTISDLELDQGFEDMAKSLGQEPQVMRKFYEARDLVGSFREKLLEEKTLNYLAKGAKIAEVPASQMSRGQE